MLRADFDGPKPVPVFSLPVLSTGALTLQREAAPSGDAGLDGGVVIVGDAGAPDNPCADSTREATIPLPIRREWLEPRTWLKPEERLPEERQERKWRPASPSCAFRFGHAQTWPR